MTTIDVAGWAADMARNDARICAEHSDDGIAFDATWSGEHLSALAELLELPIAQIDESDIQCARTAYEHEARRILEGAPARQPGPRG